MVKKSFVFIFLILFVVLLLGFWFVNNNKVVSTGTTINGIDFDVDYELFTWDNLPADVVFERESVQSFTNPDGVTHYYEAVYLPSGNLNWYQAAYLAQDAGGYLVSFTSEEENMFVFDLISDEKYFWIFPPGTGKNNHYEISIGPFIGAYQPEGSVEPDGGWIWLSGESWDYNNWCVDLYCDSSMFGGCEDKDTPTEIDQDPRPNDQPNDSGNDPEGQPVAAFGEMNAPVPTWGDFMNDIGTYGMGRTPGSSYGFVIEYDGSPA